MHINKIKFPTFVANIFLLIIIVIGFSVRIRDLGENPAGFFCDEASIGYNAYSILKTGKDEWGEKFPIFFKAFGEYKNPLDIYFTIPFVAIFGLNEFAARFPSVFFSLLSLIVLYYLGKEIKDERFGLLLMFVFAINPWGVHLSRINLEGLQIFIFFLLLCQFFLIKYQQNEKPFDFIFFSLFCGLATYSYFPARIIMPLFFVGIIAYLSFTKKSAPFLAGIIVFILICLPLLFHLASPEGLSRWRQVSLLNQKNLNPIKKITTSYLLHFSPDFLFFKGDIDMPGQAVTRHSIRGIGELYLWQLPFIILGVYYLITKRSKLSLTIFLLLFLYPIPSSLTTDISPQVTRSIAGIVPFTFLTAFGVDYFFLWLDKINPLKKSLIFSLFFLVVIFSFSHFIQLLNLYPLYSSDFWGWQYGPKEIIKYFLANRNNYDELFISGEFNGGQIFLKFYDPDNLCQNKCKMGDLWRTPEIVNPPKRQLFSLSPEFLKSSKFKNKFKIKKIIYYPNGKVAFYIGEVY